MWVDKIDEFIWEYISQPINQNNVPDTGKDTLWTLTEEYSLVDVISPEIMVKISDIIQSTDLSSYLIDPIDFLAIQNKQGELVSFGRIYAIWENQKELSSLWVNPSYRGKKIGQEMTKQLIQQKKWNAELYLAAKHNLIWYYEALWFTLITDNIPEKLVHTKLRAQSQWIDFIVMKLFIH